MMDEKLNLLAYDVGNSAVRTILCRYENGTVSSEEVLVEPNGSFEENGYLYWDMDAVFESMKRGLALAAKKCNKINSVGICTWGVDFRLLDEDGRFIAKALCYRNSIGEEEISKLSQAERESMFYRTGILSDRINSVYMLKGIARHMPQVFAKARKLLMVPDVFVYMFTGVLMNEPSELSTTQMLDVKTMQISREMCDYAGVTPELFSQIGEHGKAVGNILPEILAEAGIDYDIPLVCVPSHDTASAVTGIPSPETDYLFVSSGTWALIGADTDKPVITDETMRANLTNEVGAFGRTTLLRNSAGMFILQRLKAEYQEETGSKISWNDFTELAADWTEEPKIYDVNDSRFFNPEKMAEEIWGVLHGECAGAGAAETGAAGEKSCAAGTDAVGDVFCQ
ncbi:MAG: rhamnulokinase [Lachnospiraceae bacterium]|nr:rhamnulokinase [Lachnospiraceae bacterium]